MSTPLLFYTSIRLAKEWLHCFAGRWYSLMKCYAGQLTLEGLRVNQLNLTRKLSGQLQIDQQGVHVHAKVGTRLIRACLSA